MRAEAVREAPVGRYEVDIEAMKEDKHNGEEAFLNAEYGFGVVPETHGSQ